MDYTIIRDTREKTGWNFDPFGNCLGMECRVLKTGDYSIKGFEDLVAIERKRNVEEIATNIGKKSVQFEAEMKRMTTIPHSYILCEFNLQELLSFPATSTLSRQQRAQIRITGKFILKRLLEYQMNYNVKILFCGDAYGAYNVACSIFKRVVERMNG